MVSTLRIMLMSIGLLTLMSMVEASCPNRCSGHGSCGTSDVCACQQNWLGGDCSARQCAFTRAWSDTAQHENDAHYYAECGNRGTCDRTTGLCICDLGYTGSGCRRMTCPNDCSGHGTCEFIEELAIDDDKRVAGNTANTYAAWDTEKIVGCKCDPYYEGHDCSAKMCPKGDDPLTTGQSEMEQYLVLGHDKANNEANFALTYYDPYGNAWTTDMIDAKSVSIGGASPVDSDFTDPTHHAPICAKVQEKLRRLPNHAFDAVTVVANAGADFLDFTRTSDDASTNGAGTSTAAPTDSASGVVASTAAWRCLITFPTEPGTTGLQHLLKCHVGNRATAGYFPILTGTLPDECHVGEYAAASSTTEIKLTEISDCSGRGTCDSSTGLCMCYSGHKGTACEKQEALV